MPPHASWTCLLFVPVLVSLWGLTGCGTAAVSAGADPIHMHLFCLASDAGDKVTCDPQERLAHLNAWVKEAIYQPHATFTIWQVGPDRSGSRRFFSACVPERWGSQVSQAKSAFIQKAREGAGGSRTGLSVPAGCAPPSQTTPGRSQLVVFPDASPLPSDLWQKVVSGSPPAQIHSAIVCDRSESTQGASCTTSVLLGLFDRWVAEGLLLPGESLSVEMVGPLRDALRPFYQLRVPDLPVEERIAYVLGARVELVRLFAGGEQYGSTIAEAISTAVRRLRERRGVYRLTVLSDMQQITAGGFDFSMALPTPQAFLAWLQQKGLATDLQNIPVLVCGIPTGHFGHNSQAYAARLQDVWQRLFQSQGAPEIQWFSSCEAAFAS